MADLKSALRSVAAGLIRRTVDFALPPRCPGCGVITETEHSFCFDCWRRLDFLGPPCCARCGLPFDHDQGEDSLCGACLAEPPAFDQLRAAVAYGEIPRKVALKLKYGGRPGTAETIARFAMRHLEPSADALLVPVPLHRWRIWKRGYNQSALIAASLARRTGVEAKMDVIERVKTTPPLGRLSPSERRAALRGAFRVGPKHRDSVRGRRIILVDDVYTSGATANGCARVLRHAGAARIELLCWARVVRGAEDDVPLTSAGGLLTSI
jgi:ComF family protein